ncbi:hypothetical protein [Burkholderia oklahomensis]|uniref:hypothetical protein n=1 Tax=Burkholderia oklahomensis TaxID=342113 RepID=UPI00016A83A6|nr:hypothetical protein [Burkholderia oklahomensis]AJX30497.1 hypothetical protein BG90_3023 [Burkholderia oklahomensis C6786]AOI45664.1 hypothetical protein WI23_07590 [Burkholderia oklahomensis C6786]KUY64844.1 hypothetical protein WI23_06120 [Burkholderia oklahomensis C6786]MBI0358228.1 hypothetical protein [Burkholderia oklahomensis]SUW56152.1 Uncharacterised protein [Burkholderia oklahomensis]
MKAPFVNVASTGLRPRRAAAARAAGFRLVRIGERPVVYTSFGAAHDPGRAFHARPARAMRDVDAMLVASRARR